MTTTFAATMGQKDFSKKTIKSLGRKGIDIVGIQMVPGSGPLTWAKIMTDRQWGRLANGIKDLKEIMPDEHVVQFCRVIEKTFKDSPKQWIGWKNFLVMCGLGDLEV